MNVNRFSSTNREKRTKLSLAVEKRLYRVSKRIKYRVANGKGSVIPVNRYKIRKRLKFVKEPGSLVVGLYLLPFHLEPELSEICPPFPLADAPPSLPPDP